jgi:stage V sporulation protein B
VLRRRLGAFLPVLSVVRVIVATAAAIAVGRVLPLGGRGKLFTLIEAAIVGAAFLVVLVITRELGRGDLEAIKAVRRSRARAREPIEP